MSTNSTGNGNQALEKLRQFAATTTIKGLPKAVKAQTKCQLGLWIFALLAGTSVTAFQLYSVLKLYMDYGTIDQVSSNTNTPPFPDVTVCNLNPLWANKFIKNELNISISFFNYNAARYYQYLSDIRDLKTRDLFLPLLSTAAIMQTINHRQLEQDPGSNPFFSCVLIDYRGKTFEKRCLEAIRSVFIPQFGPCFTYRHQDDFLRDPIRMSAILFLNDFVYEGLSNFYMNPVATYAYGAKVVVHPKGTFPDMDDGMNIAPGTEATFRVEYKELSSMGPPYSQCRHKEINASAYNSFTYTSKLCKSVCLQEHIIKKCNCVQMETISLPSQRSKAPFCGGFVDWNIDNILKNLNCAQYAQIEHEKYDKKACDCAKPCKMKKYTADVVSAPWPHEAYYLSFYYNYLRNSAVAEKFRLLEYYYNLTFEHNMGEEVHRWLRNYTDIARNFIQINIEVELNNTVTVNKVPKVSAASLTGTIGGILNLWIGFSFVTIIEIVDTLYMVLVVIFVKPKTSKVTCVSNAAWQQ